MVAVTLPQTFEWDAEWQQIRDEVEAAQATLAASEAVPDDVHKLVLRLGERLEAHSDAELQGLDPYLVVALQGGTIQALRALDLVEQRAARRGVRVGLERVRQALRDVADESEPSADRGTKLVVRWLVDTLDAPHAQVADLLDTSPRTLQRWLSDGPTRPRGEDAARVRQVTRVTNQLRHVLTGEGVLRWFYAPDPRIGGRRPVDLLADPDEVPRLMGIAASARVSAAT